MPAGRHHSGPPSSRAAPSDAQRRTSGRQRDVVCYTPGAEKVFHTPSDLRGSWQALPHCRPAIAGSPARSVRPAASGRAAASINLAASARGRGSESVTQRRAARSLAVVTVLKHQRRRSTGEDMAQESRAVPPLHSSQTQSRTTVTLPAGQQQTQTQTQQHTSREPLSCQLLQPCQQLGRVQQVRALSQRQHTASVQQQQQQQPPPAQDLSLAAPELPAASSSPGRGQAGSLEQEAPGAAGGSDCEEGEDEEALGDTEEKEGIQSEEEEEEAEQVGEHSFGRGGAGDESDVNDDDVPQLELDKLCHCKGMQPIEGRDDLQAARRSGLKVQQFFAKASCLTDRCDLGSLQTFRVGDAVLLRWPRDDDPLAGDVALARIEAIAKGSDGCIYILPCWGYLWEDIRSRPKPARSSARAGSSEEGAEEQADREANGDLSMRGRREVFMQTQADAAVCCDRKGSWNPLSAVLRRCQLRYMDEIPDLKAYTSEDDAYFYRYQRQGLRFEAALLPGQAQVQRPSLIRPHEAIGLDVFGGSGSVSLGAQDAGFRMIGVVEKDKDAQSSYLANIVKPQAGPPAASTTAEQHALLSLLGADEHRPTTLEEVVGRLEGREAELRSAARLALLHFSPPCQSLSPANAHKGLDRYREELKPLLAQMVRLVELLQPLSISIEEVPSFLACSMPRLQPKLRKGLGAAAAKQARETVTVSAWLEVIPHLLLMDYQVDIRLANAVHFGTPQSRLRCIVTAVKRGYKLPLPPEPLYYYKKANGQLWLSTDDSLAGEGVLQGGWQQLLQKASQRLPHALTVRDAIADLPSLLLDPATARCSKGCALMRYGPRQQQQRGQRGSWGQEGTGSYAQYCREGAGDWLEDHERRDTEGQSAMDWDQPSGTVMGKPEYSEQKKPKNRHPAEQRTLTLAENKRLQGMRDRMKLMGDLSSKLRQVGNAVPPLLAYHWLAPVFTALTGRPPPTSVPIFKSLSPQPSSGAQDEEVEEERTAGAGLPGQQPQEPPLQEQVLVAPAPTAAAAAAGDEAEEEESEGMAWQAAEQSLQEQVPDSDEPGSNAELPSQHKLSPQQQQQRAVGGQGAPSPLRQLFQRVVAALQKGKEPDGAQPSDGSVAPTEPAVQRSPAKRQQQGQAADSTPSKRARLYEQAGGVAIKQEPQAQPAAPPGGQRGGVSEVIELDLNEGGDEVIDLTGED